MKKSRIYLFNYLVFVAPLFFSYTLFFIIPIVFGLSYSLYDWNGLSVEKTFVGLDNYVKLFGDSNYWSSLSFTLRHAVLYVVFTNIFALLMALWVNGNLRTALFARVSFFLPNVLCAVIVGMLWRFIFNQSIPSLGKLTGISTLGTKLLASQNTAWIAVLIVSLWTSCGYNMIIYIAGLVSIDRSYYESAAIDGAGSISSFFKITLPLMMPSITITLFNTTAGAFKMFDLNLSLTGGGPGRSTTGMALDVYNTAFSERRMGYGQAKAIILLILVVLIVFIQMQFTRKKEVEM
ncbi:MAG: carbohydrate ABC transporter permease [Christensenellales bacterium]|jgi:raffinose/stachyose/melibiose transport system permease protein